MWGPLIADTTKKTQRKCFKKGCAATDRREPWRFKSSRFKAAMGHSNSQDALSRAMTGESIQSSIEESWRRCLDRWKEGSHEVSIGIHTPSLLLLFSLAPERPRATTATQLYLPSVLKLLGLPNSFTPDLAFCSSSFCSASFNTPSPARRFWQSCIGWGEQ